MQRAQLNKQIAGWRSSLEVKGRLVLEVLSGFLSMSIQIIDYQKHKNL
jgi:hypothetical protein